MLRFILRRFAAAGILLVFASIASFALVLAAPGNVAIVIAEQRSPTASRIEVEKIEAEFGLNDPIPVRYLRWVRTMLSGDLGKSLRTEEDVGAALMRRSRTTGLLVLGGGVVGLAVGLGLGFCGALWPGGIFDRVVRGVALLGASTPTFFVAALLVLLFGVVLGLLPTFGLSGPSSWILPWLAIGIVPGAMLSRLVRVSIEDAMSRPYVTTASSKGFSRREILIRDALPNLAPTLVNAFGIKIALMVQAAIVVEPIFAWQGLGHYFVEAARFRDFQVLQSTLLFFSVFFISVNLLVDLATVFLDPKQRTALTAPRASK